MPTEFETTQLPSKECPECSESSLILGVEIGVGKSIRIHYQIYCKHEDECGFTGEYSEIDRTYPSEYKTLEDAKQDAIEKAYRSALTKFEQNY